MKSKNITLKFSLLCFTLICLILFSSCKKSTEPDSGTGEGYEKDSYSDPSASTKNDSVAEKVPPSAPIQQPDADLQFYVPRPFNDIKVIYNLRY